MKVGDNSLLRLPRGWIWTELKELVLDPKGDIVDGPFGSNLKASEYVDSGVPIIRLQNVDRNRFVSKNIRYIRHEKAKQLERHSFVKNDIVMTKLGAPLGKACLVPEDMEYGIIVADIVRVRTDAQFFPKKYLVYAINSNIVVKQLARTRGTTRPRVNLSRVRKLKIPFAPLSEQYRIVAKIDELSTKLNAGTESLRKVKTQLQRYRQAVLKYAFEGKLTEEWRKTHKHEIEPASVLLGRIKDERKENEKGKYKELPPIDASKLPELPESWIWAKLGTICKTTSGGTPSRKNKNYYRGKIPWLKSGELNNQKIYSTEEHITEEGLLNSSAKIFPKGTLLIALYGATTGKLGILELDAATNQAICAIFPYCEISRQFLFWHLTKYRNELLNIRIGGAQPNISQQILKNSPLPLAPLFEQYKIIEEIETRLSVADEVEKIVERSLNKSERMRRSILKKAFEGRLVPQDPTDEPAEKLLERIREEKEKCKSREKIEKKDERKGNLKQLELVRYVK